MSNRKFAYSVLFLGMLIFISIPMYYLWIGIVLPVHLILLSFSLAIAFGFFATRQAMKDEEEKSMEKSNGQV